MNIVEVTPEQFDRWLSEGSTCFQTAAFNKLNAAKCDKVLFLLFKDTKIRLGLVAGIKGKTLQSPFSAPFGGFSTNDPKPSLHILEEAIDALDKYAAQIGMDTIQITFPPLFYHSSFLSKMQEICFEKNYQLTHWDLNYFFPAKRFTDNYETTHLARNARKNLHIALTKNFRFKCGSGEEDLKAAYAIIANNRKEKGFYISMSEAEIIETSRCIKLDSFIVTLDEKPVAAAITCRVTHKIAQIIYWGDLIEYATQKTMNYLSFMIFEYYYRQKTDLIDVGTAMLGNRPNHGLCEFKESIGCEVSPKFTFVKQLWHEAPGPEANQ
jgi:hypothetical protein